MVCGAVFPPGIHAPQVGLPQRRQPAIPFPDCFQSVTPVAHILRLRPSPPFSRHPVDSSDATGRHLLCINVPEGLAASAVDIHSISSSHEEEVVLQCYSWLTVSRVHRGPTDIAGIDVLIELELATPPEA